MFEEIRVTITLKVSLQSLNIQEVTDTIFQFLLMVDTLRTLFLTRLFWKGIIPY